ncbi:acetylajmalan esterase-like [Aristolochia californica]|uniref:acetylajmalan esterase-like n=1 Tax=Aristolochia californica TaxID=171875 RepID=UPI0035D76B9A
MASSKSAIAIIVLAIAILWFPDSAASATSPRSGGFDAIYSLGDSIADTGNLIREGLGPFGAINRLPYGETYFRRPTGRCSDGRLMIDFIAQRFHLPFLNAYLDRNASFANEVNFAVAGATALDVSYLESAARLVRNPPRVSLFYAEQCTAKLGTALFFVGEIGGNDYNYAFFQGKTVRIMVSNR